MFFVMIVAVPVMYRNSKEVLGLLHIGSVYSISDRQLDVLQHQPLQRLVSKFFQIKNVSLLIPSS